MELKKLRIKENRIELLNELGIYSAEDLLTHYPYRYEIIEETDLMSDKVIIEATLASAPKVFFKGKVSTMSFTVLYHEQEMRVTIFNRHFLRQNMTTGMLLTVIGKYNGKGIVASDLKLKPVKEISGIVPVYALKDGLTQKSMLGYVKKAYAALKDSLVDEIPSALIIKHHLVHKQMAIEMIHFPDTKKDIIEALRHLKYEEFLKFQLTMQYTKQVRSEKKGIAKTFDFLKVTKFMNSLPFALTSDQQKTIQEILMDLMSNKMMYRFVQGDVGSGKTIVAAVGLYANYLAGYQGCFMAPTEILASQHYASFTKLFDGLGIHIGLLTGHLSVKEKETMYDKLKKHEIDIVIGTHALFQDKVEYDNLGFVVTDEQHRFGVNQRKALKEKGKQVDFMVMSATPIPRTLAISLYGDMDVSTIKTMPKGRLPVITKVYEGSSMKPFLRELNHYLASGGQVYVVCPLIEGNEESSSRDAISIYEGMVKYYKDQYHIAVLHGKMSDEEKEAIMQDFKDNKIQILVATTVIEVGVDVENANMMVIYNSERFGLSSLHQLRGRVGRGKQQGYCYLLTDGKTKEAIERLKVLEETNDGFEISKKDLEIRGPGDILGSRQSGLPVFMIGDIFKDFNILEVARTDCDELLHSHSNDPVYLKLIKNIEEQLTQNNEYVD